METEKNNHQNNLDSFKDVVDIANVFKILLVNAKIILFLLFTGILISVSIFTFSTRTYSVNSLLQVYLSEGPTLGGNQSFDLMLGSQSRDINNLIAIYKSRSNLVTLIDNLNLHLSFENDLLNKIDLKEFKFNNKSEKKNYFYLKFSDSKYELFDADKSLVLESNYKILTKKNDIQIQIDSINDIQLNQYYGFIHQNPSSLYETYKRKIKLNSISDSRGSFYKTDNLLQVSIQTSNVESGKRIINEANRIYVANNIEVESTRATKVLSFIDDQIKSLKTILDQNNLRLKSFKEENSSIDVTLEIKSIIDQLTEVEQSLSKLDLEIAEAEINYTSSNPLYLNLFNQKNALEEQKNLIESQIRSLPNTQQRFINLFKDVEVSQDLYTELTNQRLNYSILQASTIGNIRLIDEAYKGPRVSPRLINIPITSFLFLVLGIIFALVRGRFFTPIINPAEISENGIESPLVGVLPFLPLDKIDHSSGEIFTQSLESLIFNLKILKEEKNAKVILITSPTEKNGKSFVSIRVAQKLAELGQKILLIDNDLKRGDLNSSLNKETITEKQFFEINTQTIKNIESTKNLFFIPRISKLDRSFNFLNKNYFKKLDELKETFDFVIIDSAPILSVSDSSVLMSYSDANLCIVRHDLTRINEIKSTTNIANQLGVKIDGIIYNGFKRSTRYFYYGGYEYSYYRDKYIYQNYDYEK